MTDAVNPAEIAAPDANVAPDLENVADPSPAVPDADDKPKGVGKRIDELTRNWRETERDRDHWREIALRNQPPQEPTRESAKPEEKRKKLADFDYDEEKYEAYVFERADERVGSVVDSRLAQTQEREASERRKASFNSRSAEFAKTVEDFESVAYDRKLPISADMAEVIQDSDDGPALLYHLGKNRDIAEKIAQLPPKAAARELGRIEERLTLERVKAKEAKAAVSKAPPPPPKVEATEPAINVKPDDPESDSWNAEEWARKRNKQLARKKA